MPNYDVVILVAPSTANTEGKITVTVDAASYEETERGYLDFYKGQDNKKVASFKSWDYVTKQSEGPPP